MLDFSHPDVSYETLETYFVIELQKMLLESRTLGTGIQESAQTSKLDQSETWPSTLGRVILGKLHPCLRTRHLMRTVQITPLSWGYSTTMSGI